MAIPVCITNKISIGTPLGLGQTWTKCIMNKEGKFRGYLVEDKQREDIYGQKGHDMNASSHLGYFNC